MVFPLRLLLLEDVVRYQQQFRQVLCTLPEAVEIELLVVATTQRALEILATNDNSTVVVVVDQNLLGEATLGDVVAQYCAENGIPYCRWSSEDSKKLFSQCALFCLEKPCGEGRLRWAIRRLLATRRQQKSWVCWWFPWVRS